MLGRRADGYHVLDSLVVFADVGDRLTLDAGRALVARRARRRPRRRPARSTTISCSRPRGRSRREIPDLKLGRFTLDKRLPVAAGLGGGSSDAAAALRLLARANRLALDDTRLLKAARRRRRRRAGLPRSARRGGCAASAKCCRRRWRCRSLPAVLVNPGVRGADQGRVRGARPASRRQREARAAGRGALPRDRDGLIELLAGERNDLEPAAIKLQPVIARVLDALRKERAAATRAHVRLGRDLLWTVQLVRAAAAAAARICGRAAALVGESYGFWIAIVAAASPCHARRRAEITPSPADLLALLACRPAGAGPMRRRFQSLLGSMSREAAAAGISQTSSRRRSSA